MAGALTGIGTSAAQAYELSASDMVVTVALNSDQTTRLAADSGQAGRLRASAVPTVNPSGVLWEPLNDLNWAPALSDCALRAHQADRESVTVVFGVFTITCIY